MSQSKTSDGFEFDCDSCGEVFSPPQLGRGSASRDFTESWEDAKRSGWRCFRNKKGDWEHKCPKCL